MYIKTELLPRCNDTKLLKTDIFITMIAAQDLQLSFAPFNFILIDQSFCFDIDFIYFVYNDYTTFILMQP